MKHLRVLVIDDERADRNAAVAMLQSRGHTVLTAQNGIEGVALALKERPDLILMDLVMPQLNGFQATRQLSRNVATQDIPVIVVSCKDQDSDRIWAIKQGASAYLTKDISQATLFRVIDTVLA